MGTNQKKSLLQQAFSGYRRATGHSDLLHPGRTDLKQKVRSCHDMTARLAKIDPSQSIAHSGNRSHLTAPAFATIDADLQLDAFVF